MGGVWLRGDSGHSSGTGINRDAEKFALAAANGWRVMPLTPEMVETGQAVKLLAQALLEVA